MNVFKVLSSITLLIFYIHLAASAFSKNDCRKDVHEGEVQCLGYFQVFKWDHDRQRCVEAIYGGCHPTNNNFVTEEECQDTAATVCKETLGDSKFDKADCAKDVQEGPFHCAAFIPVYKWDQEQQECVRRIYGGCHPTNNNFNTAEECEKYASPICREVSASGDLKFEEEDCDRDVEYEPFSCAAFIPVYKWDQMQQKCVKAIYGGCNPTKNNFHTLQDCEIYAAPICKK